MARKPDPKPSPEDLTLGVSIRTHREARGWTQLELAKKVPVSRNAVTQWEKGTHRPEHPKILKLMKIFGTGRLGNVSMPDLPDIEVSADEGMAVDGYVAASSWQEKDELGQAPTEYIPISRDPAYPNRRQYAIKVRGTSMNRVVQDGDYVIVADAFAVSPRDGEIVVVKRSQDGGLIERSLKVYRAPKNRGEPPALVPDSTDDRFKPLALEGNVELEAVVIGYYRRAARR